MSNVPSPSGSSPSSSSTGSEPSSPDSTFSVHSQPLPDRTVRRNAKRKTFLFIDSQADDSKGSSLRKQKQAFLVKKYHHEKKQASIERLKAAKLPPQPRPLPAYREPIPRTAGNGKESQDDEHLCEAAKGAVLKAEAWSLTPYLSQGFMDPFNCYSVHMTDSMHMYLNYFRIHGTAAAYPLNMKSMGIFLWKNAITIPALLNILLYFSAKHLAVLGSKNGVSSECTTMSVKDSLRLQGNALKHLNNLLQDPKQAVTQPTIITIACFITIEASMGNLEAVEAHLSGLKRLVDVFGGLDTLHHMTLSRLYQCDVKGACVRKSRPVFPMSPRFRCNICNQSKVFQPDPHFEPPPALASLGVRFTTAPWLLDIDRTMRASLEIVRRIIIYFESAQQHPELVTPTDNDLLVVTEHQLHSLCFTPDDDNLNEPLRLSLIIYLNIRVWHLQNLPIMGTLVAPLRHILTRHLLSFQALAPDLIFWMLFMGGMASRRDELHPWFITQLTVTASQLGVRDWKQARAILGEFFYTDQPGQQEAEDVWDEVILARSYPDIAPSPTLQIVQI